MQNQNQKIANNKQNQSNPKKEKDSVQADKAIELMRYNKINAKNAFDINVDFIESLSNILNKNEEAAWQKASASLDVSAKVYGYRVDSVHSETFQFLGGLNRNKKGEKEGKENPEEEKEVEEEKKNNAKVRRGQNTLETNLNKLNLTKYDLDTEVDPLFSIMTSKFNEINANGLLLNTIPLDERLNYILESKKVDNKNKKLNNDNNKENLNLNQNEEIKEMDINSDDSYENLRSKKEKKDPFLLNLEKNNYLDDESEPPKPIVCSEDMLQIPESIKSVLADFKSENPIDQFTKEKICPELTIFKQSRELTENENNDLFLKHFKEEINLAEFKKNNEYLDAQGIQEEPENIDDSEHLDMENIPEDANEESNNNENVIDPNDIKDIEDSSMDPNLQMNRGELNNNLSMSLFKYDDLIEHSQKFGSGNLDILKNLPQFNQFQQNFGKIEGKNFFSKNMILGLNKKKQGGQRKKKEEILFEFNEDNEININELLSEKSNKNRKKKGYDFTNDYENKKKVKCFYNYDKLATFRLFTINNKTIYSKEIDNDINLVEQEQKIIDKIEEEQYDNNNDFGNNDNDGFDNYSGNQNNSKDFNNNAFFQSEKEIEKNFGRLYRRFDIRSLKNKIWNNYENQFPNDNIDFRNIISNMSKEMTDDELYSISTSTCFVCMLHLCNEKNLFVNQNNINTFYVEKDSDGYKSESISKRKGDDDITKPKTRKKKNKKKIDNSDEDEDEEMIMNEE